MRKIFIKVCNIYRDYILKATVYITVIFNILWYTITIFFRRTSDNDCILTIVRYILQNSIFVSSSFIEVMHIVFKKYSTLYVTSHSH